MLPGGSEAIKCPYLYRDESYPCLREGSLPPRPHAESETAYSCCWSRSCHRQPLDLGVTYCIYLLLVLVLPGGCESVLLSSLCMLKLDNAISTLRDNLTTSIVTGMVKDRREKLGEYLGLPRPTDPPLNYPENARHFAGGAPEPASSPHPVTP
jgi:hypothetical protein